MSKPDDIIGRRFTRYIVVGREGYRGKNLYMKCRCDCGNERAIYIDQIRRGLAKSCGCIKTHKMEGLRFGRLTVKSYVGSLNKRRRYSCTCDCGTELVVRGPDLRSGKQISCGCYKNENTARRNKQNAIHGMTHTGAYNSWFAMRGRCNEPNHISYKWYGAKGVTVCERWNDFKLFHKDMGDRPDGMTLDRIDPYGHYEPENCRWATPKEQGRNKRDKSIHL